MHFEVAFYIYIYIYSILVCFLDFWNDCKWNLSFVFNKENVCLFFFPYFGLCSVASSFHNAVTDSKKRLGDSAFAFVFFLTILNVKYQIEAYFAHNTHMCLERGTAVTFAVPLLLIVVKLLTSCWVELKHGFSVKTI